MLTSAQAGICRCIESEFMLLEACLEALRFGLKMRGAQRDYFKEKSRDKLVQSKELEKQFDAAAARVIELAKGRPRT